MHIFDELSEENFMLYASRYYNNNQCSTVDEFYEDVNRIKYIKRLLTRYYRDDDLQDRLLLNHIITFYNVFGIEAGNKMLFFKIDPDHISVLKTFLVYLDYIKENSMVEVPLDPTVIDRLRKI